MESPVVHKLFWNICVCGLITFVAMSVAMQQRPDPVRHELSRFNHAIRFQTIAPVGSLISRYRQINPETEFDISTSSNGFTSIDTNLPAGRIGREPRFVSQTKVIRLAVLAPNDPEHQFSLYKILPAIHLAARTIERSSSGNSSGPLSGWRIQIVNRDSKCSSIYGPLEAIDLYNSKSIGTILFCLFFVCFLLFIHCDILFSLTYIVLAYSIQSHLACRYCTMCYNGLAQPIYASIYFYA